MAKITIEKKNNLGGLDLSRRGLDRDSRSRRRQRVTLDSRENLDFNNLDRDKKKVDLDMKDNLDGFQKLVSK